MTRLPDAMIPTLNEQLGSILDESGDTAWVIRNVVSGHLHTIAGNRRTAEHVVRKKSEEYGTPIEAYSIEVWHIMQSPEDYDDE